MNEQRHPRLRRIPHWVMALPILIMNGSGWRIDNASPIFGFLTYPEWATLRGDVEASLARQGDPGVATAIAWRFAAMWMLVISYVLVVPWGMVASHFRRAVLPVGPRSVLRDFVAALRFQLGNRLGEYNAVQKAAYIGVLAAVVLMILSGIAFWKPVQTYPLERLFGGFQDARAVHFFVMAGLVLFLRVPVATNPDCSAYAVGHRAWPRHRTTLGAHCMTRHDTG